MLPEKRFGPVITAGVLVGLGLGGLIDSIFFRQILHLHSFLSGKVPVRSAQNLQTSLLADGLLQVVMVASLVWAVLLLFGAAKDKDVAWSGQLLFGGWFLGWGGYLILEGLLSHQLLNLHHFLDHANPAAQETGDWAYLIVGVLFAVFGYWGIHSTRNEFEEKERDVVKAKHRAAEVKGDKKVYLD